MYTENASNLNSSRRIKGERFKIENKIMFMFFIILTENCDA